MKSTDRDFCHICKLSLKNRGSFNNTGTIPETGEDSHTWIYIPKNSSAHVECYIHECVRISFEKITSNSEDKVSLRSQ